MSPQPGPSEPDLLIGQTIGNYLVTQKLGEGGMGSVYLAEHPSIGKKVALKVLHSEFSTNQEVATRFFNEAKAVNDIGHPNIVDIVDFGIIQAGPNREQLVYFIMEYLAGQTLSQLIRAEAPLPPERALGIALQVADALAASHKCGIVHRDLKPDNIILMQRARERDFVKLLDFGIAKLTTDQAGSRRTRTGIVMGTPAYMSPEQCEGRGNIDHRTDIYALGIVLYEMMIGRVPFLGEGYGEILVQHLTQPPVPLSQFRMMNAHVEAVIMKALEKRPDLRYPTMDEMMRAMSDPVGYVESHGGVVGFKQRTLMPSNGPIPSVRMSTHIPTPAPGTMIQMPGQTPTTGLSTPVPTTLGASTGEVSGAGIRKGFLILGGLVVAAAIAAVVVVVSSGDKVAAGDGSDQGSQGSGSDLIAGTDPGSNQPPAVTPDAPPAGSAATVSGGSGSGDPGAGSGSAAMADPGIGSAGAGSSADGSAGGSYVPTIPDPVVITLTTRPAGARILVDGEERGKTPEPFKLPRNGKQVKIVLRLAGYEDVAVPLTVNEDFSNDYALKKKKVQPPPPNPGKGSGSGKNPPPNPGKGSNSDDSGLMAPS